MILILSRRVRCMRVSRDPAGRARAVHVMVPAGAYRCERVGNPIGEASSFDPHWLVLWGRGIGQSERGWARFAGPKGHVRIVEAEMDEAAIDEERWEDDGGPAADRPPRLVQVENQHTIGRWARETFPGGDDMDPRHCIRLLEEVVELCLAAGAFPVDVRDAVIGSLPRPSDWGTSSPELPDKVAKEMADCAIVLDVLAERRGINLRDHVDSKMKINRARRWKCNGDGTGYHIKADAGSSETGTNPEL